MLHRIAQTTRACQKFFGYRMPTTGNKTGIVRVSGHRHLCGLLYSEPTWVRLVWGAFVYNVRSHKHTSASTDFIHGANQHPHIHIPAIFRIVMGKLRLHLSSILGVEIGIQITYAISTISCKASKMPVETLGAIFHGTCKKRALIIKRSITLLPYVSISVIPTTKC